ncbi:MAG TPA: nucleotide exchange factor GrpE [Gemmataceae bacterium]|jgi:molecular chaperone GrpE
MTRHKEQNSAAASKNANEAAEDQAAEQVLEDLESLRAKLQEAEQKRDEYLYLAQRTRADFENYQKRMKRDQAEERRYAQLPLAADLLSALDNLERATAAAEQAGEKGALVQGVTMVLAQALDILRRHGIKRIEAQGQPFDPNCHQAVLQQPSREQPPMTVLQVLEQGYMIHDRVLRPARVIVSTAPEQTDKPE